MTRPRHRQLTLAFADSPKGGEDVGRVDVSTQATNLPQRAEVSDRSAEAPQCPGAAGHALLEGIASLENLKMALSRVVRNKGAPGVDGKTVEEVARNAEDLLPRLRHMLIAGTYQPGDVRRVWIPKSGGGQRGLGIPTVVDRLVQEAVLQLMEPIFEATFHPNSHGFRPGRGAQTAIAEARRYAEAGYRYVVDIDLEKFFDRVNHQRLLDRVAQRVTDRRVLRLIGSMLRAKVALPDGTRVSTEEGTPQGGPLSPLLSNIVLDELDRELARRGLRFVRYADDCQIYVRSERAGHRVMASTRRFIEGRLRLKVNETKSAVALSHQRHFLGFKVGTTRRGWVVVLLSERSFKRLAARIRELTPRNWGQSLEACLSRLNGYLRGWMAYFRLCTVEVRRVLEYFDCHIRRRLRGILITQKKKPRILRRALLAHGAPRNAARTAAYCRCGPWRKANLPGVTRAYRNDWFLGRLDSLVALWQASRVTPTTAVAVATPDPTSRM